jgi:hypothetical protein
MSSRPITIRKHSGETWEILGDVDCLPALMRLADRWRGWGYTIAEGDSATPITVAKENKSMSKRKQIVDFAKSYTGGEVPIAKSDVLHALEETARKRGMSLSKFIETGEGNAMYQVYKNAPGYDVPQRPVFKTSYEALQWEAAEHRRKAGLVDAGGERDATDPNYESQADKAINAVADSLVKAGKFSSRQIARRFMAGSPAYSGLFSANPKYREQIAGMLRDHLP